MSAKVSLLVPTYNVETFLPEALESISQQDFENWEAIVVDDGSKDATPDILTMYVKNDARFKLFLNDKNYGLVRSLNFGLRHCSGDYIVRFDGDDIMLPRKLSSQLKFLELNSDVELVGSDAYTMSECGKIVGRSRFLLNNYTIEKAIRYFNPILHCWMARKRVYIALQGYRNIKGAEDYDFLARGILLGLKYASIGRPLIKIRKRSSNTASTFAEEQGRSIILIQEMLGRGKIFEVNKEVRCSAVERKVQKYRAAAAIANGYFTDKQDLSLQQVYLIASSGLYAKMMLARRLSRIVTYFERIPLTRVSFAGANP